MSPLRACSVFLRAVALAAPCWLGASVQAAGPNPAATDPGGAEAATWSRWQGRIGLSSPGAGGRALDARDPLAARSGLSLLGDYYFTQNGLAARDRHSGGFRATGGLFVGPRSGLWLATPTSLSAGLVMQRRGFGLLSPPAASTTDTFDGSSVPYVGVGYTGLKSLRATGGGWGFSADVGVIGLQPRSRVRLGPQEAVDDARDPLLSPLLQVGVSYSF